MHYNLLEVANIYIMIVTPRKGYFQSTVTAVSIYF